MRKLLINRREKLLFILLAILLIVCIITTTNIIVNTFYVEKQVNIGKCSWPKINSTIKNTLPLILHEEWHSYAAGDLDKLAYCEIDDIA